MNVLVLGGTRFIGAAAVRLLVAQGHRVLVVHRGIHEQGDDGAAHIHVPRDQLASIRPELERFAPEVALDTSASSETDAWQALQALRGIAPRLVALSSVDVYRAYERLHGLRPGPADPGPLAEDAPKRESSYPRRAWASGPADWLYSYDKLLVEAAYLSASDLQAVTILRLPFVYGAGDYRQRVGKVLETLRQSGKRLSLPADRAAWRSTRGHVQDVASAIAAAILDARGPARVFNVGERLALSELEWYFAIAEAAGWDGELACDDAPKSDGTPPVDWAHHLVMDTSALRHETGWAEAKGARERIAETVAWELGAGSSLGAGA